MKVAIIGYGNLGKSLEQVCKSTHGVNLVGVYSRRRIDNALYKPFDTLGKNNDFDVGLVALGSYNDVVANFDKLTGFDSVDSYDCHAKIGNYKQFVAEKKANKVSIIGVGWDPGVLSLLRGVGSIFGQTNTIWGKGISQGHSNAVKSLPSVLDAVSFTLPKANAKQLDFGQKISPTQLHDRICYVSCVSTDKELVTKQITHMPHYFDGYDTKIEFVTKSEIERLKQDKSHNGYVVGQGSNATLTCNLAVAHNTMLTAQIMVAYAKAIALLKKDGFVGALDVFDIPLKYLADSENV